MRNKSVLLLLILCTFSARAGENDRMPSDIIQGFRPIYLVSGIPVDGTPVNNNTGDVKFQISFALRLFRNMGGVEGLNMKIGYSQRSVWYLYAKSSPFKDNMYIPGIYLDVPLKNDRSTLLCGLEHRSNGLDNEYSRSLNYLFGEYTYSFPFGLSLSANARFGIGYYGEGMTQSVFYNFYGYATVGACYECGRFSALLSLTPLFAPFKMNTTAELAFRIAKKKESPYHIFIQYHNGYDECLKDCVYGSSPLHYLRFGLLITPRGSSRLSM